MTDRERAPIWSHHAFNRLPRYVTRADALCDYLIAIHSGRADDPGLYVRQIRLRQVHGDFHPWKILFELGADFRLLDRSRGEFGDPADDVTSLIFDPTQVNAYCGI